MRRAPVWHMLAERRAQLLLRLTISVLACVHQNEKNSAAKMCTTQAVQCDQDFSQTVPVHEALTVEYSQEPKAGLVATHLKRPPRSTSLVTGNYPVTLLVGTKSSGLTMVEFILKVNTVVHDSQVTLNLPSNGPVDIPTNFEFKFNWMFSGQLSDQGNVFFHSVEDGGYIYDGVPSVVNFEQDIGDPNDNKDDVPAYGTLSWSPCLAQSGLYYFCTSAVSIPRQDNSGATYRWSETKCALLRVVEDLPPKLSFYYKDKPFQDVDHFDLYMGQSLEAVVNASDNFQDTIGEMGISKISINTGDELRARVTYVYDNVDKAYTDVRVAKMPRLVEVAAPSFLNFYVGGPRNMTIAKMRKHQRDKVISYTPTRMHSGLKFTVCFLATDDRGMCSKLGDWSERCLDIAVQRCKYSMQPGQDMTQVAGLFQMDWIQLFALNPTFKTPEAAVADKEAIINIGHLYEVSAGEDIHSILRRFGMHQKDLMFVNVDLSRQREAMWTSKLPEGQAVCIVPNSCGTLV